MTNTHVPTGEPWYGHDGFGCAPNLCQSCRDEIEALRAETARQKQIIEDLQDGWSELQADNERLKSYAEMQYVAAMNDEMARLRAEIERLKAELVEADRKVREYRPNVDAALAENKRLRAALRGHSSGTSRALDHPVAQRRAASEDGICGPILPSERSAVARATAAATR